jgi:hypothetical protein
MEKKQAERKAIEKRHAPTNATAINYSSKTFFIDALKKMVEDQIITSYTKDKLLGFPFFYKIRSETEDRNHSVLSF